MVHGITLGELKSEARWNRYLLFQQGTSVICTHLQRRTITRTFSLEPDPTVPQILAPYYGSIQAYYWVRGYNVEEREGLLTISRGRQHPGFNRRVQVSMRLACHDFRDLDDLILELSKWVVEAEAAWQQLQYQRNRRRKRALHLLRLGSLCVAIFFLVSVVLMLLSLPGLLFATLLAWGVLLSLAAWREKAIFVAPITLTILLYGRFQTYLVIEHGPTDFGQCLLATASILLMTFGQLLGELNIQRSIRSVQPLHSARIGELVCIGLALMVSSYIFVV